MNSYDRIYNMVTETNFPGDERVRQFTAGTTRGRSLLGPKLKKAGDDHATKLDKTKTDGTSILAKHKQNKRLMDMLDNLK